LNNPFVIILEKKKISGIKRGWNLYGFYGTYGMDIYIGAGSIWNGHLYRSWFHLEWTFI